MKITVGNVFCCLSDLYPKERKIIDDAASGFVSGYRHMELFQKGYWDGKVHLLKNGEFPTGLLGLVIKTCIKSGIKFTLSDTRVRPTAAINELNLKDVNLRDYQIACVEECVKRLPRGIIYCAPNAGKTEIGIAITQRLNAKTLWIANRISLIDQTAERFRSRLGVSIGRIAAGSYLPQKITVASIESLWAIFDPYRIEYSTQCYHCRYAFVIKKPAKKRSPIKCEKCGGDFIPAINKKKALKSSNAIVMRDALINYLKSVDVVISDECSHVPSRTWYTILTHIHAYYRFGLSATPFNDSASDLELVGALGPVIYRIDNNELISNNISSRPEFDIREVVQPDSFDVKNSAWPQCENLGIIENIYRNAIIVEEAERAAKNSLSVIVLFCKLRHGRALYDTLRERIGESVRILTGSDNIATRNGVIEDFKLGRVRVIIASTIFDEGISIDDIDLLIIAGGGRSSQRAIQRAGRALRKNKTGCVRIVDFYDKTNDFLKRHSEARFAAYKKDGLM